jgi:hypothetical protein
MTRAALIAASAAISVLCGASSTPASTPASPGRPLPGGSVSVTSADAPQAVFHASISRLTPAMRARMTGVSWHPGCPVGLGQLRLLRLSYVGFDHVVHQGRLIVNASVARKVVRAFRLLFAARFPIRQMRVVDDFGGSDERSMRADNTSAFNCRFVRGTHSWSMHAFGLAVDVNPVQNPEILSGGVVDPPAGARWTDRSRPNPAMIKEGGAAERAFTAIGWGWGGEWRSPRDYMHFSANGR